MATNSIHTVKYRRKRDAKTNYKKRLELLKSGKPRLVIRRTNSGMIAQVVSYAPDGDNVLMTFHSNQLEAYGWSYSKKSIPACYLAGLVIGTKMKDIVDSAIIDLGLQTPSSGTRLFAVARGAIDAGLSIPCSQKAFPDESRLRGEHIAKGADVLELKATSYKKNNLKMQDIPSAVDSVKEKILSSNSR
ncbi:MAG: 50S ribosomal protein L18 [Nanoarchaeota archaeon]